jgi:hypothetical protein
MDKKFYGKSHLIFENLFLIGLEPCLEDLKNLGICLNCFEPKFARELKQIRNRKNRNQKRKMKKNKEKKRGHGGPIRPSLKKSPRPTPDRSQTGMNSSASLSLTPGSTRHPLLLPSLPLPWYLPQPSINTRKP